MNKAKKCTILLSIVAYFVLLGATIISPILPLYALTFEVSLAMVGGLISGFGLARLLLDVPTGMVVERIGMKRFMLIGLAVVAIGALISGSAISYWMLLMGRVIEGVGSALYTTTSFTCMGKIAPKDERGKYMSFYLGLLLLGTVSGPAIGGYIGENIALNAPFYFYSICAALSFFLILFGVDRSLTRSVESEGSDINVGMIKSMLKDYTFSSINVAIFMIFVIRMGVIATLVPIFAVENLGLSESTLGFVLTLSALMNFVVMVPAGHLTDVYGRKWFMASSLFFTGLITLFIPFSSGLIVFAALMTVLGIALGLSGPIMAWVTDISKPNEVGTAMGIFRTMSDAGFVVGPLALTMLSTSQGPGLEPLPFAVAGLLIAAASFLLMRARDPIKQEAAETKEV